MNDPLLASDATCCDPLVTAAAIPNAADLVAIAKALADPVRLQIVDLLRAQGAAVCVCDLQPRFDITQPTLSHHLKRLREAGLVTVERRQQWAYYSLVSERMEVLARWLS
ncbi:MAG TPA: metalloregulator ArsR/SmtB family transcription factor [Anaerolineae bacterium]|nr:metalloregulator ArsR/SmtB family transcription factor [Anaerolineae bacterium]